MYDFRQKCNNAAFIDQQATARRLQAQSTRTAAVTSADAAAALF